MSKKKDSFKPWLSRPAINRSVTVPFTTSLTHRLSSLGEFHPNDLDPFLLFDARDSMIGTLENPTLDLDPSKPDTLNVITATRAGTATYTDANGLIASSPANTVRVDYTQGAELTPTKFQNVVQTDYSASPNGGFNMNLTDIDGPEGASGGVRVSETAVNGQHYLSINRIPVVSGQSYTVSFYIKEGAYSSVRVYTQSSRINTDVNFNFSTGTATFGGSDLIANSGIVSTVGGGWYRVSYSAIASNGGLMSLYVTVKDLSSYAGDVNNFTDYYGFQVEEGTTASSFVANTTGSPKFITGPTFGPRVPMILVEPSATNLVPYSADFSHGSWTKESGTVVIANTTETNSPTGSSDASKITSNGSKGLYYASGSSASLNTKSVFLKGVSGGEQVILKDPWGLVTQKTLTLTTEWVRYSLSETQSGNFGIWIDNIPSNGIYMWGAQLETGSVSTSYIPTSGSTVTRAADDLVISGSAFDFYNQSEGTFYAESNTRLSDEQPFIVSVDNGDNNRIILYNATTSVRGFVKTSGSTQADFSIGTRPSANTLNRTALSYKTNNVQGSLNGGSVITDTSVSISNSINRMNIGTRYNQGDANKLNGHIKRLIYWPLHSDSL